MNGSRRADAVRNTLIPISTVFAGSTDAFIAGLSAFRADPQALDDWVIGFAQATETAAATAVKLADDIAALDVELYEQLVDFRRAQGRNPAVPRRDAVSLRILDTLATDHVVTAESVSERLEVSPAAAHRALTELHEAGILGRSKNQKGRTICWTADRHLALVALTERSNRVGGEDARNRKPKRGPAAPPAGRASELVLGAVRGHRRGSGTRRRGRPRAQAPLRLRLPRSRSRTVASSPA